MVQVLIIDRVLDVSVWDDRLYKCDSSGSRSVWFFTSRREFYGEAEDLPDAVFKKIEWHVHNLRWNGNNVQLCIKREDPGLGIWIPEIDQPIKDAGQLPDGCIPTEQSTTTTTA